MRQREQQVQSPGDWSLPGKSGWKGLGVGRFPLGFMNQDEVEILGAFEKRRDRISSSAS